MLGIKHDGSFAWHVICCTDECSFLSRVLFSCMSLGVSDLVCSHFFLSFFPLPHPFPIPLPLPLPPSSCSSSFSFKIGSHWPEAHQILGWLRTSPGAYPSTYPLLRSQACTTTSGSSLVGLGGLELRSSCLQVRHFTDCHSSLTVGNSYGFGFKF